MTHGKRRLCTRERKDTLKIWNQNEEPGAFKNLVAKLPYGDLNLCRKIMGDKKTTGGSATGPPAGRLGGYVIKFSGEGRVTKKISY